MAFASIIGVVAPGQVPSQHPDHWGDCVSRLASRLDRLSAPLGIPVEKPYISPEMLDVVSEPPTHLKTSGTTAKPVLKRLMSRTFPAEWTCRDKQGFPTQTSRWLAGPLHGWRRLLQEDQTAVRGVLSRSAVGDNDDLLGHEAVWTSICLDIFCRQFVDGPGAL